MFFKHLEKVCMIFFVPFVVSPNILIRFKIHKSNLDAKVSS